MGFRIFLVSTRNSQMRFEVLKFDPDTGEGTLRGPLGAEFTRNISKKERERFGYKLFKMETPDEDIPAKPKDKRDRLSSARVES